MSRTQELEFPQVLQLVVKVVVKVVDLDIPVVALEEIRMVADKTVAVAVDLLRYQLVMKL